MTKARRYSKRNATSSSECQRQSCTETRSRDPHAVEVVVVAISMMVVLTRFVVWEWCSWLDLLEKPGVAADQSDDEKTKFLKTDVFGRDDLCVWAREYPNTSQTGTTSQDVSHKATRTTLPSGFQWPYATIPIHTITLQVQCTRSTFTRSW